MNERTVARAGPLQRVLGRPDGQMGRFALGSVWSRKVSVNISPIQASDEGDMVLFNTDAQSIFSHPYPVVIARLVQFPSVWDTPKIVCVSNCFEDLPNSGEYRLLLYRLQVSGKTLFEKEFHGLSFQDPVHLRCIDSR